MEEALASLGRVYYINRLEDLVSLVVDVQREPTAGKVLSPRSDCTSGAPG